MYLLDANVFIQAKNRHYGIDFCPAFWDWLVIANQNNKVFSIDAIKDEIIDGSDELVGWAKSKKLNNFFLSTDKETIISELRIISNWVYNQNYEQSAINLFLQKIPDYYLIAQAKKRNATIVTHEIPSYSLKKIKIPDVCNALEINCINTFTMLKESKAKFINDQNIKNTTM